METAATFAELVEMAKAQRAEWATFSNYHEGAFWRTRGGWLSGIAHFVREDAAHTGQSGWSMTEWTDAGGLGYINPETDGQFVLIDNAAEYYYGWCGNKYK